jgi:hypothetical protein
VWHDIPPVFFKNIISEGKGQFFQKMFFTRPSRMRDDKKVLDRRYKKALWVNCMVVRPAVQK